MLCTASLQAPQISSEWSLWPIFSWGFRDFLGGNYGNWRFFNGCWLGWCHNCWFWCQANWVATNVAIQDQPRWAQDGPWTPRFDSTPAPAGQSNLCRCFPLTWNQSCRALGRYRSTRGRWRRFPSSWFMNKSSCLLIQVLGASSCFTKPFGVSTEGQGWWMTENKRAVTVSTCSWSRCLQPQKEAHRSAYCKQGIRIGCSFEMQPISATPMAFFRGFTSWFTSGWNGRQALAWHRKPRRTGGIRRGMTPCLRLPDEVSEEQRGWLSLGHCSQAIHFIDLYKVDDVDVDLRDGWLRCAKNCMF